MTDLTHRMVAARHIVGDRIVLDWLEVCRLAEPLRFGTYYYQPSAGTGNLLISNPPFIMTTNLPPTYEEVTQGLPELTEEQFQGLYIAKGGTSQLNANSLIQYRHAFWIAQSAFHMGAFHGFRRAWDMGITKPPTLKEQALAAARIELNANGKNGALIIRALEALPE